MKNRLNAGVFLMALLVLPGMQLKAQTDGTTLKKVEKCIRDYQDHSSLGNPGSTFIDSATISAFRDLFELNANLYWDLYKTEASRTNYLLSVDDYVDSVNMIYNGLKPIISYGRYDIRLSPDGQTAIVYLVKINSLPVEKMVKKQKFSRTITMLRMLVNVHNDGVLIQNISMDTRLTRIRSCYVAWGYPFVTSISNNIFGQPVSNIDPGVTSDYSMGHISGYSLGISTDLRFDRQSADGILLNVALFYTKTSFDINISNYVYSYRQTFDPGDKAFECTVFDRANAISEKISFNSISMPVTIKWYLSKKTSGIQPGRQQNFSSQGTKGSNQSLRLKYYVRGGPQLSLVSGTTEVAYDLSHSGGGLFIYEGQKNLPGGDKIWFYLDKNNERVDGPNFFAQKTFRYSTSLSLHKVFLSAVIAFGIEAKFNKILIGLEPWLNIGITSISSQNDYTAYQLYPTAGYTSFLQTYRSPKINSFGLNVVIGKIFNRKY
jgi:hypothetical protein